MERLEHEWVTVPECCSYTRRKRHAIYGYIKRGLLTASQPVPGSRVLISRKSIEDMLARRMNRPAAPAPRK